MATESQDHFLRLSLTEGSLLGLPIRKYKRPRLESQGMQPESDGEQVPGCLLSFILPLSDPSCPKMFLAKSPRKCPIESA
mmetsp:Transcript_3872/g.7413  ORF Transcript_3872/g.7413 Transcript_3872/m.7413 type:complete len:80 (-) Transcript_3872:2017-2256(-)